MWTTNYILRDPTRQEGTRLREFMFNLYSHNMYEPLSAATAQRPGFIRKENAIIQTKDELYLKASVTFDTEENFKAFVEDESIESLYDFVMLTAYSEGFTGERFITTPND
jgi:hypothetical protein